MDYKELGVRIRQERKKNKLTQQQLADSIGISRIYITFIEHGERIISIETLLKIADYLHISTDYLLKGEVLPYEKEAVQKFEQLIKGHSNENINHILQIAIDVASKLDK